jgi:hypothetical protein
MLHLYVSWLSSAWNYEQNVWHIKFINCKRKFSYAVENVGVSSRSLNNVGIEYPCVYFEFVWIVWTFQLDRDFDAENKYKR